MALADLLATLEHDALARLAAARAAASWSGTASPLAKCISSGVWPRNAECGIRPLCSPT